MFNKLFKRICDYIEEKRNTVYVTPEMIFCHPYALWRDQYGNAIFYGVLQELKKRGYYNNMAAKKAAMEGTWYNYGWQYSAEQYVLGRNLDPKKYKDCVPANPKGKPWPTYIVAKMQNSMSVPTVRYKR